MIAGFGQGVGYQDPKFVETILGKSGGQGLYNRAFNNALLNTALMWAVMPKQSGYGSAFDPRYIARAAVMGGLPAYSGTVSQGVENFKTLYDIQNKEKQLELEKYKATTTPDYNNWLRAVEGGYDKSFAEFRKEANDYQKKLYEFTTGVPWGQDAQGNVTVQPSTETVSPFVYTPKDGGASITFPTKEQYEGFLREIGELQ